MKLPVAEFAPDQPDYPSLGSDNIINVLPRTKASYGPFPSLQVLSSALTARCQGAYSLQDKDGNVYVYAGDATKLYELAPGTTAFVDKSGATYACSSTARWSMTQFFPKVVASDFTDVIQAISSPGSGNFAALVTSGTTTLKARYLAVVRQWLVAANTFDGTDAAQPQRVWWCAIDDATNFPTPGTAAAAAAQSDYQDLIGDAGWINGVLGNLGTADGAIFQERAVTRMVYVGPPAIFAFLPAEGARGCPFPGGIIQLGSLAFYPGDDGFYAFDGSNSRPIGTQKVNEFFLGDIDQTLYHRVTAAVDPIKPIVYWAYPASGAANCNRILAYNWVLDQWSVTAADAITVEVMLRSLTLGYSLETLDNIGTNLDADPPFALSLDDRFYTGGRLQLSAFDANHKLNYFTGPNLAPTVDTAAATPGDGKRVQINRVRPLVDGGTPSVAIRYRDRLVDSVSTSTAVVMGADGTCPTRTAGRYVAVRITLPAGSTFTHISGAEIPDGSLVILGDR